MSLEMEMNIITSLNFVAVLLWDQSSVRDIMTSHFSSS